MFGSIFGLLAAAAESSYKSVAVAAAVATKTCDWDLDSTKESNALHLPILAQNIQDL